MDETELKDKLDQLNEIGIKIGEEEAQLVARQELLDSKDMSSKTITRGQRKYNLVDFLLENGDIPEAYTINKASELLGVNYKYKVQNANIIKSGQNQGKVPAFVAVDTIADEHHMSADDFLKEAKEIHQAREDMSGIKAYIKSLKEDYNDLHGTIPKGELDKWGVKEAFAFKSPQSQAADLAQRHSKVIQSDDKYILKWIADTGSADVEGIDTPKRNMVRSHGTRITPKRPKIGR
jgi:hypothetical protein